MVGRSDGILLLVLQNIQDLLADGKTPYQLRFETPFREPISSFGAEPNDHPTTTKDRMRLLQFGAKIPPRYFHRKCVQMREAAGIVIYLWYTQKKLHTKPCFGCPREEIQR